MAAMMHREWRALLELCLRNGKDVVLAQLEQVHRAYEAMEAAAWETADTRSGRARARRLQAICLRQDETMIRLRQMDEATMRALLDTVRP